MTSSVDVGSKFLFLELALADPAYRNKRKRPLSPLDFSVLVVIINRCNHKKGYSYTGQRAIAEIIHAPVSSVNRALQKLESQGLLKRVDSDGRKTARYAPCWQRMDQRYSTEHFVHLYDTEHSVHPLDTEQIVHSHGADPKEKKRTQSEQSNSCSALRSSRGRRSGLTASAGATSSDVSDIISLLE